MMNGDHEHNVSFPFACSLTRAEIGAMREGLLPGLLATGKVKEPISGGFRWRFDSGPGLVEEARAVIDAKRRGCRFLCFRLLVEPDYGPVLLEVTGPEVTEDFLSVLLYMTPGSAGKR